MIIIRIIANTQSSSSLVSKYRLTCSRDKDSFGQEPELLVKWVPLLDLVHPVELLSTEGGGL